MNVSMPAGRTHGWGIAGENLTREIARFPYLEDATLHCISGIELRPLEQEAWNRINIGYCFFESNIEAMRHAKRARKEWDFIVAGSKWCEYNLRIGGIQQTATILQGIDPQLFYPEKAQDRRDTFVVFSGGKFEYRKGQDIVISAMKVMMQRHPDVHLACAWHNQWTESMATMHHSPHITFEQPPAFSCLETCRKVLADNGIPLDRTVLYPRVNNLFMRDIYLSTDIGLFPNRCEGGNNLVMCEYMACGRTVIASSTTGHADVITPRNAIPLEPGEPVVIIQGDCPMGLWFEPSLEETVEQLEWAYQHREALHSRATAAAEDMARLSWTDAARRFLDIAIGLTR